jgi:hypothetical protein
MTVATAKDPVHLAGFSDHVRRLGKERGVLFFPYLSICSGQSSLRCAECYVRVSLHNANLAFRSESGERREAEHL